MCRKKPKRMLTSSLVAGRSAREVLKLGHLQGFEEHQSPLSNGHSLVGCNMNRGKDTCYENQNRLALTPFASPP